MDKRVQEYVAGHHSAAMVTLRPGGALRCCTGRRPSGKPRRSRLLLPQIQPALVSRNEDVSGCQHGDDNDRHR